MQRPDGFTETPWGVVRVWRVEGNRRMVRRMTSESPRPVSNWVRYLWKRQYMTTETPIAPFIDRQRLVIMAHPEIVKHLPKLGVLSIDDDLFTAHTLAGSKTVDKWTERLPALNLLLLANLVLALVLIVVGVV